MQILYLSTLLSNSMIIQLEGNSNGKLSGITVQKFHRLIVEGLQQNDNEVKVLSNVPISMNGRKSYYLKDDQEDGIKFHYPFFIDYPLLRQLFLFIGSIIYIGRWLFTTSGQKVIICDALNISISFIALFYRLFGVMVC